MTEQIPNQPPSEASPQEQSKKKGCSPLWAVVAIAVMMGGVVLLAILAAVALPMYTRFKQKAMASAYVKTTITTNVQLQDFYERNGSFSDLRFDGDDIVHGTNTVITSLPPIPDTDWNVTIDQNRSEIRWTTSPISSCPTELCSGVLCLECGPDGCQYAVVFANSMLNLDRASAQGIACSY